MERMGEKASRKDVANLIQSKLLDGFDNLVVHIDGSSFYIPARLIDREGRLDPVSLTVSIKEGESFNELVVEINLNKIDEHGRIISYFHSDWGYRLEATVGYSEKFKPGEVTTAMAIVNQLNLEDKTKLAVLKGMEVSLKEQLKQVFGRIFWGDLESNWAESVSTPVEVWDAIRDLELVGIRRER